ncbi:MAG: family 10 glycosylhydrolase [Mollicutes bacterium]|nr:family 10 glycosylhydrolase [Mollicutes bacterium]
MKKILVIIVLSIVLISNIKLDRTSIKKEEETRAIFVSYIELNKYIKGNDYEISKRNIRKIIKNIKRLKCNTIILQVRSASDAIYKSNIYPMSLNIVNTEYDDYYDVLDYFIKESHKSNVKVIAWINPYRIRTTCDKTTITEKNPAYKYLDTDIVYINNGIYYNPSKQETEDLIVKGVEELLNYDVDGILFDDYFYPDNNIDKKDYEEYIKNNEFIEEKNYRLNIVNKMIKRVYKTCKNKNIKFGISPDGNIDNNYNKNYADVKSWLKSNEYIDFIMPQIYYGFYNSTRDYIKVTKEWENLIENKDIELYIALAFYKVGMEDKYAKSGFNEWIDNDNIIMREILLSRNLKNYKGFSLFRYENIFNEEIYTKTSIKEIENLKKILN